MTRPEARVEGGRGEASSPSTRSATASLPAASSPPRWIVGNLDFEVELARIAAAARRHAGEPALESRHALPPEILRTVSALATLLRAFAGEGDRLWTPAPVEPSRMVAIRGLPLPVLESGPLEQIPRRAAILAWGETPAVEGLRLERAQVRPQVTRKAAPANPPKASRLDLDATSLHDLLWRLPPPAPGAAMAVNHRGFCLQTAELLRLALPGARMIRSPAELEAHLRQGGASASREERWVLKSPLSSAARSRLRGRGHRLEPEVLTRIERLLELSGELLFEPWMERIADFGCAGVVDEGSLGWLPPHGNDVDIGGHFRGITLWPERGPGSHRRPREAPDQHETALLEETIAAAGSRLHAAGYRGPFTIDCWRFRGPLGEARFNPLGEINARFSFGLVARALLDRLVGAEALRFAPAVHLRVEIGGSAAEGIETTESPAVPLLLPADPERSAAWLAAD